MAETAARMGNRFHSARDGALLRSVKPFVAAAAVIVTGGMLIAAIYFTLLELQWIAFLAGILVSSILAMTAQATRAGIAAEVRARQLALADYQLAAETGRRQELEKLLAAGNGRLRYADESLPAMLAFVDGDTRFRYHNRAFRDWAGLPESGIDGQHMREVLGVKAFAEMEEYLREAGNGRLIRYERTHKTPSGGQYRLAVQMLPQFSCEGKSAGTFLMLTDITQRQDVQALPAAAAAEAAADGPAQDARRRILAAINGNEFALFCQRIAPLRGERHAPSHYEVLIRLLEEESSLIPPGAFFPLAEEFGLLPQLDRWVVCHLLDWMASPEGAAGASAGTVYFVNVAAATIRDPDFPDFVAFQLRRTGVAAKSLCIEIDEADLKDNLGDAIEFARALRQSGCLAALSGFGLHGLPVETLKHLTVDFLKIHGGLVRQLLAHSSHRSKVASICRLAQAIGVRTIAELVEDDATLEMLRKLNVDCAQGFGISRPRPLSRANQPAVEVSERLAA